MQDIKSYHAVAVSRGIIIPCLIIVEYQRPAYMYNIRGFTYDTSRQCYETTEKKAWGQQWRTEQPIGRTQRDDDDTERTVFSVIFQWKRTSSKFKTKEQLGTAENYRKINCNVIM